MLRAAQGRPLRVADRHLPAPDPGERWPSRLVATAAENRLIDAMARAVPTDVVKGIVSDHYKRAAPTPPAPKSIVDQLVEKFGP